MEYFIINNAYAILNGVIFNIGIFSFSAAYDSKKLFEKVGFFLCALSLLALFIYTLRYLSFTIWVFYCWFLGFGAAAMSFGKRLGKGDSSQILRTEKMKNMVISSLRISSLLLSILVSLFVGIIIFIPKTNIIEYILVIIVAIILFILMEYISQYLSDPSRLAGFISSFSAVMILNSTLFQLDDILNRAAHKGTWLCFSISIVVSFSLYFHASAINKLAPHELSLSKSPGHHLLFSLRNSKTRPGIPLIKAIFAWILDLLSRICFSISSINKMFLIGIVFYYALMFVFIPWGKISIRSFSFFSSLLQSKSNELIYVACFHLGLILCILSFSFLKYFLQKSARNISRATYQSTVDKDERPPILFLRAFSDDHAVLPRLPIFRRLLGGRSDASSLDYLLIDSFSMFAPVVALGRPGEPKLPFGASRLYVDQDCNWTNEIVRIANDALAIVVVCAETESIDTEISIIKNNGLMNKSLFLANPKTPTKGLENHYIIEPMLNSSSVSIVAAFYKIGACSRTFVSKRLELEDYIVCCNSFFNELFKQNIESKF
jgi:hypothetical protein